MDRKVTALLLLMTALLVAACAPLPTVSSPPTVAPPDEAQVTPVVATEAATVVPSAEPLPTATSEPLAALVNGQPLPLADYEQALAQYAADLQARGVDPTSAEGQEAMKRAGEWILNVLIEQMLTEQAAVAAGVVISEAEVDAYMEMLVNENNGQEAFLAKLAERGETYESARREVRAGLIGMAMTDRITAGVPQTAEHVHARHILVDKPEKAEHPGATAQWSGFRRARPGAFVGRQHQRHGRRPRLLSTRHPGRPRGRGGGLRAPARPDQRRHHEFPGLPHRAGDRA